MSTETEMWRERALAAEAERDDGWAHQRAGAAALKIVQDKLAKATAVVEAAANPHLRLALAPSHEAMRVAWKALDAAIANHHAGPAETEEER